MIVLEKCYTANQENKQDATWESWQTLQHRNSMKTQSGTCYRNWKKKGDRGKHDETSRNYRARPLYRRICRIPCEVLWKSRPCHVQFSGIVCCTVPRKTVWFGLLKIKGSHSILNSDHYPSRFIVLSGPWPSASAEDWTIRFPDKVAEVSRFACLHPSWKY